MKNVLLVPFIWLILSIACFGQTDLVITNTTIDKDTAYITDRITGSITIQNIGNVQSTSFGNKLRIYLSSDGMLDSNDNEITFINSGYQIPPNETKTIPYTIFLNNETIGNWSLIFKINADSVVTESDYGNNYGMKSLVITNSLAYAPDLEMSNITVNFNPVYVGNSTNISYTINNNGSAYTNYTESIYLSPDNSCSTTFNDSLLYTYSSAIPNNTYKNLTRYVDLSGFSAGTWHIIVVLDEIQTIIESDESNNKMIIPINISNNPNTAPDFVIDTLINYTEDTVSQGSFISLNTKISNIGTTPTFSNSKLKLYLSSNQTWNSSDTEINYTVQTISNINPNESKSRTLECTIPSGLATGTWYLLAFIDTEDDVNEGNETNNVYPYQIYVSPLPNVQPDLDVTFASLNNTTIASQGYFMIDFDVTNIGGSTAGKIIHSSIFYSADNSYSSDDIYINNFGSQYSISPFQTVSRNSIEQLPANIPFGSGYIIVATDCRNTTYCDEIPELTQSNNYYPISIYVDSTSAYLPNLTVYDISVSDTITSFDSCLEFCATVGNYGGGITPYNYQQYPKVYLSPSTSSSDNNAIPLSIYWGSWDSDYILDINEENINCTVTSFYNIPNVTPGNYFLIFEVDSNDNIVESNENDNTDFIPITIANYPVAPDIEIFNLDIPPSASLDEVISLDFELSNNGNTNGFGSSIYFYLSQDNSLTSSNTYLNEYIYPDVPVNFNLQESSSAIIPNNLSTGLWYIIAEVMTCGDTILYNNITYDSIYIDNNPVYCGAYGYDSTNYTIFNSIDSVVINTINNTSGTDNGYGNYTNLSTTLDAGLTYPISLQTVSYSDAKNWLVWIDFDQNLVFDSTELVVDVMNTTSTTQNVVIPPTALNGSTRMRVKLYNNSYWSDNYLSPCGEFNTGEIEDYTIIINSNTTCPTSLSVPGPINNNLYEASNDVYSNGFVANTATFHAGNYIDLLPNFEVPINQQFTANINPCGTTPLAKGTAVLLTPTTTKNLWQVDFTVTQATTISLQLKNSEGEIVKTFIDEDFSIEGNHSIDIETMDLPLGLYFLHLTNENEQIVIEIPVK